MAERKCPANLSAVVTDDFKIVADGQVSLDDPRAQYDSLMAAVNHQPQCLVRRLGALGGVGICGLCGWLVAVGKPKSV